jgi:hypothetical protein
MPKCKSQRVAAESTLVLAVFFTFVTPLRSQTAKRDYPPGVIGSIQVTGNQIYSTGDILKVLGLKPGDRATVAIFDAARERVQKLDVFSTVSFNFKYAASSPPKYDVLYTVAEDTQVLPMHFERLGADPAAIRAYLKAHVPF